MSETAVFNGLAMQNYLRLAAQLAWRGVDEEWPDEDQTVLVHCPDGEPVWIGYKDGIVWRDVGGEVIEVSHWLPLPEPPQEGSR